MIVVRCGRGLGDTLYLRPIAEHYLRAGHQVTALTDYPDVFVGSEVKTEPFRRDRCTTIAHYTHGKARPGTTQFQDMLDGAGIKDPVEMRFRWDVRNRPLADRVYRQADGRPIVLVHGGRTPMSRVDGFGKELLPRREAFEQVLGELSDCLMVQVGQDQPLYRLPVDLNLNGETTVADLLDLAWVADGVVGQCSLAIPLAEAFDTPLLVVWSAAGLSSRTEFIRQITPQKILGKPTSEFVVDDWETERIQEAARAFRRLV